MEKNAVFLFRLTYTVWLCCFCADCPILKLKEYKVKHCDLSKGTGYVGWVPHLQTRNTYSQCKTTRKVRSSMLMNLPYAGLYAIHALFHLVSYLLLNCDTLELG